MTGGLAACQRRPLKHAWLWQELDLRGATKPARWLARYGDRCRAMPAVEWAVLTAEFSGLGDPDMENLPVRGCLSPPGRRARERPNVPPPGDFEGEMRCLRVTTPLSWLRWRTGFACRDQPQRVPGDHRRWSRDGRSIVPGPQPVRSSSSMAAGGGVRGQRRSARFVGLVHSARVDWSWLTAATPMDNPYCSRKLSRTG